MEVFQKYKTINKKNVMISFIAPAYKVEKYLDDFIMSFNNLSIRYEIIIINDDPSASLDKWKGKNIKIINNSMNIGQGASRNKGLGYISAESTHFSFIDPDDRLHSNEFENFIPENGIVNFGFYKWYKNKLIGPVLPNGNRTSQKLPNELWGVIFPISFLKNEAIICREFECNDYPIKIRLAKSNHFLKSPIPMIDYRIRKSSTSRNVYSTRRAKQEVFTSITLFKDGFLEKKSAYSKAVEQLARRKKSFSKEEYNKIKKELSIEKVSFWWWFTGTMIRLTNFFVVRRKIIDFFTNRVKFE